MFEVGFNVPGKPTARADPQPAECVMTFGDATLVRATWSAEAGWAPFPGRFLNTGNVRAVVSRPPGCVDPVITAYGSCDECGRIGQDAAGGGLLLLSFPSALPFRVEALVAGVAPLMADMIVRLADDFPEVGDWQGAELANAIRLLVAAAVVESPCADHGPLGRIAAVVRGRMHDPLFGPSHLARDCGMSRSKLYRTLLPEGGVRRFIIRQRLLEAHRILSDGCGEASICELSLALGFSDHSTFSRAFKRMFGYPPVAARGVRAPWACSIGRDAGRAIPLAGPQREEHHR